MDVSVREKISLLLWLDNHIINLNVDIATNLGREALLHAPLVCGSSIPEAESHGGVA
jgi:hypothetical protein